MSLCRRLYLLFEFHLFPSVVRLAQIHFPKNNKQRDQRNNSGLAIAAALSISFGSPFFPPRPRSPGRDRSANLSR